MTQPDLLDGSAFRQGGQGVSPRPTKVKREKEGSCGIWGFGLAWSWRRWSWAGARNSPRFCSPSRLLWELLIPSGWLARLAGVLRESGSDERLMLSWLEARHEEKAHDG